LEKRELDYIDDWGLLCVRTHLNTLDGGDTCANEFSRLYCLHHERPQQITAEQLVDIETKLAMLCNRLAERYLRHPDPAKWYSDTDRLSRDQLTPLLHFLALNVNSPAAKQHWNRLVKIHARRLFCFAWNTVRNFQYKTLEDHLAKSTPDVTWNPKWKLPDFCGPSIWTVYIRGALNRLPRGSAHLIFLLILPLLTLLDLESAVSSIQRRFDGETDQRNTAISTHFAARFWPTPVSLLAKLIYGTKAPRAAFKAWWADKPGEPPLHTYFNNLYKD
jgi:hypothetical protein